MSELYFRLGKMEGFTSIDLADKKEGYANPVRELFQNSLDASREADNNKCEVNIYIETISTNQIPHIDAYKKILNKAVQTAESRGSYNTQSKQLVASIENALKEKSLKILMFCDNGAGMKEEQLKAILDGVSIKKPDSGSGGSWGVGSLSTYSLSSLRYVLYATKYEDKNGRVKMLFTGSPILAGYEDGEAQRGNRGAIVTEKPKKEMKPDFLYPEVYPDFIEPKMNDLGTTVTVLGLSENWDEDAEYAIASNFFYAIAYGTLSVNIHQDGRSKVIDYNEIKTLITDKKDNQRATRESILSGRAVYQAWQAVINPNTHKKIQLSNRDTVYVCIESDINADSVIILVRNGMVIARHDSMLSAHMNNLRKDPNFDPFTAVIDASKEKAPELFDLIKDAEGPYHDRLRTKQLIAKRQKKLKELLEELSVKIKSYLREVERESFDLPFFQLSNEIGSQADNGKSSSGQSNKATVIRPRSPRPSPPPHPRSPGPFPPDPSPVPVIINRTLEAKNAGRYIDAGNEWEVRLKISPEKLVNNKDGVYLSICLGEDSDEKEEATFLDFIEVEVNGTKLASTGKQIKLIPLRNEGEEYKISAKIEKPNEIGSMKAALSPILGLKRS